MVDKKDILDDYAEGYSVASIAEYHGISRQYIYRIISSSPTRYELTRAINIELNHNQQEIEKTKEKLSMLEQVAAQIDKRMNNISGDKHNEKM